MDASTRSTGRTRSSLILEQSLSSDGQDSVNDQWDTLLQSQDALFKGMGRENVSLKRLIKRFSKELALSEAGRAALENEKEALLAQTSHLESSLSAFRNDQPLVICLMDGESAVFDESLLTQGKKGGQEAAFRLLYSIIQYVDDKRPTKGSQSGVRIQQGDIMANIFVNVTELTDKLAFNGICSSREFTEFIIGFNQAMPLFNMIDVGPGKGAASTNLKGEPLTRTILSMKITPIAQSENPIENLCFYSRLYQARQIIFNSTHQTDYTSTFESLRAKEFLKKVTILEGNVKIPQEKAAYLHQENKHLL